MLSRVPYHRTLAASTPITLFVEMLKIFTQKNKNSNDKKILIFGPLACFGCCQV